MQIKKYRAARYYCRFGTCTKTCNSPGGLKQHMAVCRFNPINIRASVGRTAFSPPRQRSSPPRQPSSSPTQHPRLPASAEAQTPLRFDPSSPSFRSPHTPPRSPSFSETSTHTIPPSPSHSSPRRHAWEANGRPNASVRYHEFLSGMCSLAKRANSYSYKLF